MRAVTGTGNSRAKDVLSITQEPQNLFLVCSRFLSISREIMSSLKLSLSPGIHQHGALDMWAHGSACFWLASGPIRLHCHPPACLPYPPHSPDCELSEGCDCVSLIFVFPRSHHIPWHVVTCNNACWLDICLYTTVHTFAITSVQNTSSLNDCESLVFISGFYHLPPVWTHLFPFVHVEYILCRVAGVTFVKLRSDNGMSLPKSSSGFPSCTEAGFLQMWKAL